MELRREWQVFGQGIVCRDYPTSERDCGWSFQWRCCHCGADIAQVACFKHGDLQPYRFISGCCLGCGHRGHRHDVPGSLERFELLHWSIPKPILDYQLSVELAFLDHPEHPHNKVYAS